MNSWKRLLIAVILAIAVSPAFAGDPHTSYGIVEGTEANNSCAWVFCLLKDPATTLQGNLTELSGIWIYQIAVGNLEWNVGDDSMVMVKKEKNSGQSNHTAFYAVMNEDIEIAFPQRYNNCTLREVPIPTASAAGNGVALSWPAAQTDPSETPHGNNVTGYNIYRSTSQSGGFSKINGSLVTTTNYTDSSGVPGTTYYYAIELVFRSSVVLGVYSANSNGIQFPVPTPNVTGISPNNGTQGDTLNVTISGANASWSGDMTSAVHFSGTGITVNSATGNGLSISANISIASGAATTARTVTVDGATGSATFNVNPAVIPNVTGISPNSGRQEETLDVVIGGNNASWSGDMTSSVNFSGTGITINSATGAGNSISANITIASNADLGNRTVTVAGATGSATFTVTIAQSLEGDVEINIIHNPATGNIYWISLPYVNDFEYASEIIAKINNDHGLPADSGNKINQIGRWDGTSQSYQTYDYLDLGPPFGGSWSGTDFAIVTGEAIYLNVASDVNAILPGIHDLNFAFNLTYNAATGNIHWISLPKTSSCSDAVSIIADVNSNAGLPADSGDLVNQIGRWDGASQSYQTYDYLDLGPPFGGSWSGNNFSFTPGEGYYINLTGNINNWGPSTN